MVKKYKKTCKYEMIVLSFAINISIKDYII